MNRFRYFHALALPVLLATAVWADEPARLVLDRDLQVAADGSIRIVHKGFPPQARNPWPAAEEEAFWQRVNHFLPSWKDAAAKPSQTLESQGHDVAMLAWLAGDRVRAQAWFVQEDSERASFAHTEGIDFYWGFTLKYRPHWWFAFGHTFPQPYRQRVLKAAKAWTETDPRPSLEYVLLLENEVPAVRAEALRMCKALWRSRDAVKAMAAEARKDKHPNRQAFAAYLEKALADWPEVMPDTPARWRGWYALLAAGDWKVYEEYERLVNPRPHPTYGFGRGPVGTIWNVEVRGGWADARNTDNLRAMREIAAYLFAEEAGNETTRLVMKEKLRRTLVSYYSVGMGEWDSGTYHPASANTWVGLHDYARDEEVRLIAKGVLDYLWTISALKYRGGGWGGPMCRDYGGWKPWQDDAADSAWIYYGDLKARPPEPIKSWVNQILSPYRPPMAVMALARRQFDRPREIFTSHPTYQTWLPGNDEQPETHSTLFYGKTYQVGTRARGSFYNINGIKTLLDSDDGLVDFLLTTGGTGNIAVANAGGDRVGHYRNLVLYLNGSDPKAPFRFAATRQLPHEIDRGVLFIRGDRTWVAIRPIHLAIDPEPVFTREALGLKKGRRQESDRPMVIHAAGDGAGAVRGFAMELGEKATHGDYTAFKAKVLAKSAVETGDTDAAGRQKVTFTGSDGSTVALKLGEDLPQLWRNGVLHDWDRHRALYSPADGGRAPVSLGWKQRKLHVEAGGYAFDGEVTEKGRYRFQTGRSVLGEQ